MIELKEIERDSGSVWRHCSGDGDANKDSGGVPFKGMLETLLGGLS